MSEGTYKVEVACNFDATSPEDAVAQMAEWLDDYAYATGYRVYDLSLPEGDAVFIDAEALDWQKVWADSE